MRLALALALFLATPALAAKITPIAPTPATCATLAAVVKAATSGQTITLAPGSVCTASIQLRDRAFVPAITIDATGAQLLGGLTFFKETGVHVVGGQFGPQMYGGVGFSTDYGNDITLTGARVTGLDYGISFGRSTNVAAVRNRVDFIRVDSIRAFNVQVGLIADNWINGAAPIDPAAHHPDLIQLASDLSVTSDITITGNHLAGDAQGITAFLGSRLQGGYDRLTITDNDVVSSYSQGIGLYNCRVCDVRRNKITTAPTAAKVSRLVIVGAVGWSLPKDGSPDANVFIDNR